MEKKKKRGPALCGAVRSKKKKKWGSGAVRRCAEKKKKKGGPALCGAVQRGTGAVRRCAEKKKRGSGAVRRCAEGDRRCAALCGKKKIQVRILVLWKTRIGEFSFSGK